MTVDMNTITGADIQVGQLWYWDTALERDRGSHQVTEVSGEKIVLRRISGKGAPEHTTTVGNLLALWVLIG